MTPASRPRLAFTSSISAGNLPRAQMRSAPDVEGNPGQASRRNFSSGRRALQTGRPAGREVPVEQGAVRHDPTWVDPAVRGEVVPLDVVEVRRLAERGDRVQVSGVRPQGGVVAEPANA